MSETVERLDLDAIRKRYGIAAPEGIVGHMPPTVANRFHIAELVEMDVPALLARVEELEAEVSRLRAAPEVAEPDEAHWNPHGGADWEAWEKLNADHRRTLAELEEAEAAIDLIRTPSEPVSREAERVVEGWADPRRTSAWPAAIADSFTRWISGSTEAGCSSERSATIGRPRLYEGRATTPLSAPPPPKASPTVADPMSTPGERSSSSENSGAHDWLILMMVSSTCGFAIGAALARKGPKENPYACYLVDSPGITRTPLDSIPARHPVYVP